MARMKELQPEMEKLKERAGDDRQKMQQGMHKKNARERSLAFFLCSIIKFILQEYLLKPQVQNSNIFELKKY